MFWSGCRGSQGWAEGGKEGGRRAVVQEGMVGWREVWCHMSGGDTMGIRLQWRREGKREGGRKKLEDPCLEEKAYRRRDEGRLRVAGGGRFRKGKSDAH